MSVGVAVGSKVGLFVIVGVCVGRGDGDGLISSVGETVDCLADEPAQLTRIALKAMMTLKYKLRFILGVMIAYPE